MAERIALVHILAEDLRSANFLRSYVQRSTDPRRITIRICSQGAADQFVLAQYPTEVHEQRRRVHGTQRNAALVVHVDADTESVQHRYDQLTTALRNSDQVERGNGELIAVIVPRRHTETWLHGLCGEPVTEEQDCKRDLSNHDEKIKPAADALYQLTRLNAPPPPTHLPALARAVPELRRLE